MLGQHELIDDGATVTMDVTGQDLGLPDVQSGRLTFTMRTISQRVGVTSAAIRFVITIEGTLTGRDGTQLYTGPLATLTLADVTADCAPGPAKADVQVTKSGPARVNPDGTVTYTLEVLNNGPGTAEDVTVQDPVSADLTDVTTATSGCSVTGTSAKTLDCALGAMADGARREVTFTAKVKPGIGPETVIDNCGTVYTTTEETSEGNNQSCLQTTVEPPPPAVRTDVGVVKQGPGTTTAGGTVTYTVTVTNHGTSEASDVVLGDILGPLGTLAGTPPEGCTTEGRTLTCEIGSLAPGETRTYTVTATVAPGAANGQALTNCASSDTSTPETDETNNESCVQTIVGEQAPTAVTDLSVAKYGSAAITPDGRAVYQLTVTNNSAVDAKDVVISDVLGDFLAVYRVPRLCTLNDRVLTCSVGTLAAGESTTISLTAFPAGNAVLGDSLQNCESAQTTTPESTLENNHSCAATLITDTAVPPRTDVRITKSAPATARPGGPVRYALTVSNPGTHPAEGVVVEDVLADEFSTVAALPAGCALDGRTLTCAVGTLAPGARRTFTITATVRNDAALGSVVENCGVVYPVTLDSATLGSCVSTLLKRVIPIGPAPTGGGFAPSGTGVPAGTRAPATAGGLALIAAGALLAAVGRRARRRPGPGLSALPGDEG